MDKKQGQLGHILIKKGLLNAEQLKDALEEQKKTKEFLGSILLRGNRIKEKNLLAALSDQFNIPFVSFNDKYIDWDFVSQFSSSLILDYRCFPLKRDEGSITIAITNPLDARVLKKAEEESRGFKLKLVLLTEDDLNEAIRRYQQHIRGKYL